jgi:hypothetical protein
MLWSFNDNALDVDLKISLNGEEASTYKTISWGNIWPTQKGNMDNTSQPLSPKGQEQ